MKKVLSAIILIAVFLSAAGCSDINGSEHGTGGQNEDVTMGAFEVVSGIYLCDDVYLTDETPSYGDGYVYFPSGSDVFEVSDFRLLLCDDGCDRCDVVSRAFQGYAPAYEVVETHELSGKYPIYKFKSQLPGDMEKELMAQGAYDEVTKRINSSYHYLADLGENIYAYICLERKEGATEYENEIKLADDVIKKATFDLSIAKIPFAKDQLYAVAYLGYGENGEVPDYSAYSARYLGGQQVPVHHVSCGDWYLVIPKDENTELKLYKSNIEAQTPVLIFESDKAKPFIVHCNVSDIFPDIRVELHSDAGIVDFSPYISLKDGSVMIGERGLDITE